MKHGEAKARAAVAAWLATKTEPVIMAELACVADRAASQHRKSDLFDSVFAYDCLLPPGWRGAWMNESGSRFDGSMYMAAKVGAMGALRQTKVVPGFFDAAVDA